MTHSYQQTIKKEVSLTGVGLHTGQNVTVTFLPAPANHGIKFQRVDMPEKPVIPADCELVTTVQRGTTLEKNGAIIATVEHLMSALIGLQIDNVLVQTDGIEIPIMDGSARPFVEAIEKLAGRIYEQYREIYSNLSFTNYYRYDLDIYFC